MADQTTFHVLISNPERTFFDGQATSVSAANHSGPFDILANHAHFISLLQNQTVTVVTDQGQSQASQVVRGLLSAKDNQVRVFVDL
jgi:F0F1-type ATP synthase epsilon subunit